MREIKFRAYDHKTKEMSAPFTLSIIEEYIKDGYVGFRPERWDIMQYTGLKDKNGKEICEGDIVKDGWGEGTGEVKFIYGHFYLGFGYCENLSSQAEDCEVISNIYE